MPRSGDPLFRFVPRSVLWSSPDNPPQARSLAVDTQNFSNLNSNHSQQAVTYRRCLRNGHPRWACRSKICCSRCYHFGHVKKACRLSPKPKFCWMPKTQSTKSCPKIFWRPKTPIPNEDLVKVVASPPLAKPIDPEATAFDPNHSADPSPSPDSSPPPNYTTGNS